MTDRAEQLSFYTNKVYDNLVDLRGQNSRNQSIVSTLHLTMKEYLEICFPDMSWKQEYKCEIPFTRSRARSVDICGFNLEENIKIIIEFKFSRKDVQSNITSTMFNMLACPKAIKYMSPNTKHISILFCPKNTIGKEQKRETNSVEEMDLIQYNNSSEKYLCKVLSFDQNRANEDKQLVRSVLENMKTFINEWIQNAQQ